MFQQSRLSKRGLETKPNLLTYTEAGRVKRVWKTFHFWIAVPQSKNTCIVQLTYTEAGPDIDSPETTIRTSELSSIIREPTYDMGTNQYIMLETIWYMLSGVLLEKYKTSTGSKIQQVILTARKRGKLCNGCHLGNSGFYQAIRRKRPK